jgi:hypothetical protein
MEELQLGGKLSQDTANEVMRSSAGKAGRFGTGLGLGRDVSARDLGLKSLALEQYRLNQANAFGGQQDSWLAAHSGAKNRYGLDSASLGLQAQSIRNSLGLSLDQLGQQDRAYANQIWLQNQQQKQYEDQLYRTDQNSAYARAMQTAQFGQSIAQPTVGLNAGSYADLVTGKANAAQAAASNQAGIAAQTANGLTQLGGNLMGSALGGYMSGGYGQTQTPSSLYTPKSTSLYTNSINPAATGGAYNPFGLPSSGQFASSFGVGK